MVSSLFWRYKMKKIRELRADEIEVRVGIVKKNGISLLLYKDARCDMNILDETFGITGWQRKHELINGALFCTVSIKGENGEWISKQDVGVESYTEAVKGAASDSFKRACFNIGIGRELYKNAPEHRGTAVTKDIFKIWSVEPEVIWKQVLENMGKESLFLMLVVTEEENSLMTFEDAFQKNQGALALLQKSILDEAKKKLEEPFYILPVSIFELMIVPESQADEVEEMKKAIIESNHEMPVEYLLSNNVYYYGEKEEVEIAG